MKNNEYTLESLKVLNPKFQPHGIVAEINDDDVNIVNTLIKHMERLRATTGKAVVGDSVRFTNENGTYYHHAMIDEIGNKVTICESPSAFIMCNGDVVLSGGRFKSVSLDKLVYIGKTGRTFWTFGHCGPCVHGNIYFKAFVNEFECKLNTNKGD